MSQYPFSAVVGMPDMRLALLLNAVSPNIGGVLVRGEKGTAKSTAVRALAAVLPPVEVIDGCRFACGPSAPDPQCPDGPHETGAPSSARPTHLVELPVGSTEDRLTGSLDVEKALTQGVTVFQPGLLAGAHRGVLYVDEVNLLHDHLVDLLLDAAALGTNYVERDGVSVRHAARFLLVGTMNPEEGELRPQLLDRFGLTVEVAAPRDSAARAEVVRRRMAFDDAPDAFVTRFADDEAELAGRITAARAALASVVLPDDMLTKIADVCAAFDVDGLRADIVIARTAVAHAAWTGHDTVTTEDIRVAARLALPHRRRRNPFDAPGLDEQQLDDALGPEDTEPEGDGPDGDGPDGDGPDGDGPDGDGPDGGDGTPPGDQLQDPVDSSPGSADDQQPGDGQPGDAPREQPERREQPAPSGAGSQAVTAPGETFRTRRLEAPGVGHGAAGRRSRAETETGRAIGSQQPEGRLRHLHVTSTLAAAAPHQRRRGRTGPGLVLVRDDLRESRREGREANLVLFAVDASGSMAARSRMAAVKGAVLSLLLDAYQRRDKIGMISFRADRAELLLPPTSSVEAGAARLQTLATGGRTPLEAGLLEAHATLTRERLRDPDRRALLVVVTDGRHTSGGDPARAAALLRTAGVASIVVDCESGPVRLGMAGTLAVQLGGTALQLGELAAGSLADAVRSVREVA